MSKIRNQFKNRKIKISKELLSALESAHLTEDAIEQIISIFSLAQETRKKREEISKGIVLYPNSEISPEEILQNTYSRLDGLIERTEELKSRVNSINLELQKIAYFS